jgi:S1-C subfamily serine protease
MKKLTAAWCLLLLLAGFGRAEESPQQPTQPHQAMAQSVVLIRSVSQDYDYTMPWKQTSMQQGSGSGLIIAGNRILTNAHNVSNCKYVEVKKQEYAKRYPATVAFIGHDCDLAILKVSDESFFAGTVPLELGDVPQANTTVTTYGFPVGGEYLSVTEGVVSRVQMDNYSHTGADSHLIIQTDAAINPGNSGGPVMQQGKVVGVAFQGLRSADNIGYMIPTTVIRHFLTDIDDERYDSFGSLGFTSYPGLHNASYKKYLKVPAQEEGIVVLSTLLNSSAENVLQSNDVITQIDDYKIDNDGKVWIDGLQLHLSEVIERKQIGDKVTITFYRDGQQQQKTLDIRLNRPVLGYAREYDKAPEYVVYGGLVFVQVTRNFLETAGSKWIFDIPCYLRYLFYYSQQLNHEHQRREYVVLAEILPDEVNAYCDSFMSLPVESVNGTDIWSLADLHKNVNQTEGDFCVIRFMGTTQPLIIDTKKAQSRQQAILTQYQVPAANRL